MNGNHAPMLTGTLILLWLFLRLTSRNQSVTGGTRIFAVTVFALILNWIVSEVVFRALSDGAAH
jgi:hypothetical protein